MRQFQRHGLSICRNDGCVWPRRAVSPSSCPRHTISARRSVLVVALLASAPLHAQTASPSVASCDGRHISAIAINPERPSFAGSASRWRAIAHALGLHHTTTRASVIRAYLLVKAGDVCDSTHLAESRRVLRTLPFLADAEVSARGDSTGGVIVEVRTIDEVPVIATGSLRGGTPSAISLGNENVAGLGTRIVLGGERDRVYRGARRAEIADYGLLGTDVFGQTEIVREHIGGHVSIEIAHPFLTSLQHATWHASYRNGRDYPTIFGPSSDNETVGLGTVQWSVGGALRRDIGPIVTLTGAVALSSKLDQRSGALLLTNSGAVAIDDSVVAGRIVNYSSTRVGALLGAREVRFATRQGLDALFATQDIMLGWQVGGAVAPAVASRTYRDVLTAPSGYIGVASNNLFAFSDIEAELTDAMGGKASNSRILNGRIVGYATPTTRVTVRLENNFSLIDQPKVPTQLTMSDPIGGARGYLGSRLAGGRRDLTRLEVRWATPNAFHRGDLGVAAFTDAATLWAGGVPYGTSASRQSVGLSVLAAYPTRSKRLYRLDIAFPLQRADSRGGVEIRFTAGNPTVRSTTEPYDVTRARQAPVPSALVTWPER